MIGILTLVSADNCGSLLQAYALKYILKKQYKKNVELIPYYPASARKMYRVFHRSFFSSPERVWNTIKCLNQLIAQKNDYNKFRRETLKLGSKKIFDAKSLWLYCQKYNQIIVGSDQVWNVNMFDFDEAYFLKGYNGKKVSYAASLGGNENQGIPEKLYSYKNSIEKMDYISVREPKGKEFIEKIISRDVSLCIDPTLLVKQDVWMNLAGSRQVKEDYVFFYSYNYGDDVLNDLVSKCSDLLGLPVYVINASRWIGRNPEKYKFSIYDIGGPYAFLNLMCYAKYAFVQSLHGSIFATIFKKDFWFLSNRETNEIDPRSENILTLLGVRHRILRPNNWKQVSIDEKLDYGLANDLLVKNMNTSFLYLDRVLL